jgi:hypothetical protein
VPYHFYNNGREFIFFRDTMVKSGSVDILAAMKWLVSQGLVKSTDVPTQLEYGVEICSTNGPETFPLTGLTFTFELKREARQETSLVSSRPPFSSNAPPRQGVLAAPAGARSDVLYRPVV